MSGAYSQHAYVDDTGYAYEYDQFGEYDDYDEYGLGVRGSRQTLGTYTIEAQNLVEAVMKFKTTIGTEQSQRPTWLKKN